MPDRRREKRREDDAAEDPRIIIGYETWIRRAIVHRGKILMVCTALASAAGYVLGLVGKTRDLEALTVRVAKLEVSDSIRYADVQLLKESARFQTYVVCSLSKRLDPAGAPAECGPIIQSGLRR